MRSIPHQSGRDGFTYCLNHGQERSVHLLLKRLFHLIICYKNGVSLLERTLQKAHQTGEFLKAVPPPNEKFKKN